MSRIAAPHIERIVHNLLRLNGRDPARLEAVVLEGGTVCVRGPRGAACYAGDSWMSKFSLHVSRGFFDQAATPAVSSPR